MQTGRILAAKLKTLASQCTFAKTEFEKAAVFSASSAVLAYFEQDERKWDTYLMQKVVGAVSHLNAAVGYGEDNGHSSAQHASWAFADIDTLQHLLDQKPPG